MYAFVFTLANYRIQRLGISRMRAALKRNCLISGKIDMSTPVYILCFLFDMSFDFDAGNIYIQNIVLGCYISNDFEFWSLRLAVRVGFSQHCRTAIGYHWLCYVNAFNPVVCECMRVRHSVQLSFTLFRHLQPLYSRLHYHIWSYLSFCLVMCASWLIAASISLSLIRTAFSCHLCVEEYGRNVF